MPHPFNLLYAPHLGSFEHSAGRDPIKQLTYMADLGFRAFEDNGFAGTNIAGLFGIGLLGQSPDSLNRIGETLSRLSMRMGTFTMGPAYWPPCATLASGNKEWRTKFLAMCRGAVDVCRRTNGKFVTVVPDAADPVLPLDVQTANVIEGLRYAADIFEPHGITMVLEPLSFPPQVFLKTSRQCYLLAKAVDSPACKILFDIFHLQINEGNLLKHIDLVWDEIGYFQIGDVPDRCEPGTGELNYRNILKHIYQKAKADGKEFIFGMEHYNSEAGVDGEKRLVASYVAIDDFL